MRTLIDIKFSEEKCEMIEQRLMKNHK